MFNTNDTFIHFRYNRKQIFKLTSDQEKILYTSLITIIASYMKSVEVTPSSLSILEILIDLTDNALSISKKNIINVNKILINIGAIELHKYDQSIIWDLRNIDEKFEQTASQLIMNLKLKKE